MHGHFPLPPAIVSQSPPALAGATGTPAVRVVVGLGGNRPGRHGSPEAELRAAIAALPALGLRVTAVSRIRQTPPMGPSKRRYANGAVLGLWDDSAPELLTQLKALEQLFGRRRSRRWGERVLDCDILAFGSAVIRSQRLAIPHPGLTERRFALEPFAELWPDWQHPRLHRSARQLLAQLVKPSSTIPAAIPAP